MGKSLISVHIPYIRRMTEEEMKERKLTKREREIEEAFYQEAWRVEVESWGPGVWYSDGSLMEGQVGAGAVNTRKRGDPCVYAMGDRASMGW